MPNKSHARVICLFLNESTSMKICFGTEE